MTRIEIAKVHSSTLATFVAIAIAAALFVWGYADNSNVYETSQAVIAGGIGVISYAIVYVLMYAAIMRWPGIFPDGIETDRPQFVDDLSRAIANHNGQSESSGMPDGIPDGQPVMFEAGGKWRIHINGQLLVLDERRIQREHIELIHESQPDAPSERKLHDIGISRFTSTWPNAKSVISWLEESGLAGGGEWTELGNSLFGFSPTEA